MGKILGIDVGTNSLGMVIRDEDISNPKEQIIYSSVSLFKSGVGNGTSGEYSFAAERTTYRSHRKLYKVRRYRKWATLKLLIEHGLCPLAKEDLDKWMKYNKDAKIKHQYPIHSESFLKWIRMDFCKTNPKEIITPYHLRNELATVQLDFSEEINRFKLGRAIYHIAERRGFKSSKGDTVSSAEVDDDNYDYVERKESEQKLSGMINDYMSEKGCKTVGSAYFNLINEGIRVRGSEYKCVRSDYKDEIKYIFNFQNGLDIESDLFRKLYSEKKGEGTIFYKNKLKSQKGNVGKCLLEPSKTRCPEGRPEFEEFRAWTFINNIKFGPSCSQSLTVEMKEELLNTKFVRASDFTFDSIRTWIEQKTGESYSYSHDAKARTINYKDNTKISSCSVVYRLKALLGNDWQNWSFATDNVRNNDAAHKISYIWEDVWHMCFSADDEDELQSIAEKTSLSYDLLKQLWKSIPVSYASLSLKAITNINRFLKKGLMYSDACVLAKLPDIFGKEIWNEAIEQELTSSLTSIIDCYRKEKNLITITNRLISLYKASILSNRSADHDLSYKLTEYDYADICKYSEESIGQYSWAQLSEDERNEIINGVAIYYQRFFADHKHEFIKVPTQESAIKDFVLKKYAFVDSNKLEKIYHHSQIEHYKPSKEKIDKETNLSLKLLQSPALKSLRNPMALRVMHTLRNKINGLIRAGYLREDDTRIVVEVARQLNDANMRWAIEKYNSIHETQNNAIKEALGEYASEENIRKGRLHIDQTFLIENADIDVDRFNYYIPSVGRNEKKILEEIALKYRLWLEQDCLSIYSGNPISFTALCDGNRTNIEHTLPRSRSFDDSISNLTVCERYVNEQKANKMPSELDNYTDILSRIAPWEEKLARINDNIKYWAAKGKKAQTKEAKDRCIRQRHLWELESVYWQKKVDSFHAKEIKQGFRNSQLVDTSIIAKYATLYLKSVFNRVEVQRGSTTATFRKILGIQNKDVAKDRTNHSHHAVDAFTLTLIPVPAKRDCLLEMYYRKCEMEDLQHNSDSISRDIDKELESCGLKSDRFNEVVEYIRENVLTPYEEKHQYLTPSSRKHRVRGKIVPLINEQGEVCYETDEHGDLKLDSYGNPIPLPDKWIKGDCIRGSLHKDTNYGAIKKSDGTIKYVHRCNIESFKKWDEIEKVIVNTQLLEMMKSQFDDGNIPLTTALKKGIYMLDKDGNKVNKIRHIRCYAPGNASPTPIREHIYKSNKEYKQSVYSSIGDLPLLVQYDNGKSKKYKSYHLLSLSKNKFEVPDISGYMKTLIWKGTMILFYKEKKSELYTASPSEISRRLYVLDGIEAPSRINCIRHNISNRDLGKGESLSNIDDFSSLPYKIRTGATSVKFLIEGKDFKFKNGSVEFL